jgi:hypothetical protein
MSTLEAAQMQGVSETLERIKSQLRDTTILAPHYKRMQELVKVMRSDTTKYGYLKYLREDNLNLAEQWAVFLILVVNITKTVHY